MRSATEHPDIVQKYLCEEMQEGRVAGPFQPGEVIGLHISRFGVIPKRHQTGKWRLIIDLSHPEGNSVNDGIPPDLCSLSYSKVDQVVQGILELGKGAEMAKIDIKSAYRIVPVHPQDRPLLGMEWEGQHYVDTALPFGLRSAPKVFTALADALEWILTTNGIRFVWHYLDDYITVGSPTSGECAFNLDLMVHLCQRLGIPLAVDKQVGPTTCIIYLGIEVDSIAMVLRLPQDKLIRIQELVAAWQKKKKSTKRELSSLAGQLQHAATVLRAGRTFLRRIFDALATRAAARPDHHIRLNQGLRSDLAWWNLFLPQWNGVAMMHTRDQQLPEETVTTDASGSWGCGAYWGSEWFQLTWDDRCRSDNIATKELIPIVVAAAIWGKKWQGKFVQARSDNQAVVATINSRTSRDPSIMHLLRCLFFIEASFDIVLSAAYLPGRQNELADHISRNNISPPLLLAYNMQSGPLHVPTPLKELLMGTKPDWTSAAWTEMFNSTLKEV